MKKSYFLYILIGCIFMIFFSGCNNNNQEGKEKTIITGNLSKDNTNLGEKKNLTGNIQSGIFISSDNNINILLSGDILFYKNIFNIFIDKSIYKQWEYNLSQDMYTENLIINDIYYYGINISTSFYNENQSSKEVVCNQNYQEGINYQPKTSKYISNNIDYYITYATFDVSAPDIKPSKNYQAQICFIKNKTIYKITITSPNEYRKDIVNSLKFIN